MSEVETTIESLKGKEKYDASIKKLFSYKRLIAPILKYAVPEYQDMDIEDIIDYMQEPTTRPLNDLYLQKENGEQSTINEKDVNFDIYFLVKNPMKEGKDISCYLHIDLEVQNKYNEGYPLINRAIYYAARELSSQLGVATAKTDYSQIEKSYGIWICNDNVPKDYQNSISLYEFKKSDIFGHSDENEVYDFLNIIIVRRGKDILENPNLLKYLDAVFNSKVDILDKYANIKSDEDVERAVFTMPFEGTADAIINMRIRDAVDDAVIANTFKTTIENIKAIMSSFNVDAVTAVNALKLDEELKAKCLDYFKNNN